MKVIPRASRCANVPDESAAPRLDQLPKGQRDWRPILRGAVLVLILLAWGLLVYRLDQAPPGFQHDETFSANDAMTVVHGSYPIYFPDNFGRAPLFMYSVAGVFLLTGGHYVWALHFAAALWALLGLAATFSLARRYLASGAALLAAGLMAGSFWFLLAGRLGVESISLLPLAVAMIYLFDRGLSRHSWWAFIFAGVLGGVGIYSYLASRTLYAIVGLLLVYTAVAGWWQARRTGRRWTPLKRNLAGLVLSFGLMLVVSAPLLLYVRSHAGTDGRIAELSGAVIWALHGNVAPLLRNVWDTVRSLLWSGSLAIPYQYNIPGRPALQPIWALCLLIGLGLTLARGWRRREFLLLVALAIGLLPNLLTGADALYMRAIYALPLLFILVARGLWAVGAGVQAALHRLAPAGYSRYGHALPVIGWVAVAGLLAWHVLDGSAAYFVGWAQAERTQEIYNADFRAMARYLDSSPGGEQVFIGTDRWRAWDAVTYGFYEPKRTDVQWFDLPAAPPISAQSPALYLLPASAKVPDNLAALAGVMSDRFTIAGPSGQYDLVQGFRLRPEGLARFLQQVGSHPLAEPVTYGDTLRLDATGVQDHGDYLEVVTSWTVLAPWPRQARPGYPPARPKISVAVTDATGYKWAQADATTSMPFQTWQPGQTLLEITKVPVPGDMPPAEYRLQASLYDDENGPLSIRYRDAPVAVPPPIAQWQPPAAHTATAPQPPLPVEPSAESGSPLRVLGTWEQLDALTTGLPATIHLSWQAAAQSLDTKGLSFRIRVSTPQGDTLWEQTTDGAGLLPATWPAGQTFRLTHQIELPSGLDPSMGSEARVEVCAERDGAPLACAVVGRPHIRYHTVRLTFPDQPQHAADANWAGQLLLRGYDVVQSSHAISLTLYWQTGTTPSKPLTRFIHVTGAGGANIAQSDVPLQDGEVPATMWQPGECVLDRATLQLPVDAQITALYVGLYDPVTGERLPVQLASGPAADGRAPLEMGTP
jgi:hypothetical protein